MEKIWVYNKERERERKKERKRKYNQNIKWFAFEAQI